MKIMNQGKANKTDRSNFLWILSLLTCQSFSLLPSTLSISLPQPQLGLSPIIQHHLYLKVSQMFFLSICQSSQKRHARTGPAAVGGSIYHRTESFSILVECHRIT